MNRLCAHKSASLALRLRIAHPTVSRSAASASPFLASQARLWDQHSLSRRRAGLEAGPCPDTRISRIQVAVVFGCLGLMEVVSNDSIQNGLKRKLVVVGHRGCGKNTSPALGEMPDARPSIRENTITSFNLAASNGADFVEFDVQVTRDGRPVIFHDDFILTEDKQASTIGDLSLHEFLGIGPQTGNGKGGRALLRKARDGSISSWNVTVEDSLCTLEEVFQQVDPAVGFNIEIKFNDYDDVSETELYRTISAVLLDVQRHSNGRRIYFSSFHPDAVAILRKEQGSYPVFFLTDGGGHTYKDARRNSIQAAIEVCLKSGLQGIVSEVKPILQNPSAVSEVKQAGLIMFTYGELNNLAEAVVKQKRIGVDGVIVDHVPEIVAVVRYLDQMTSLPGVHHTKMEVSVSVRAAA